MNMDATSRDAVRGTASLLFIYKTCHRRHKAAHWTRLATGIELAIVQLKRLQPLAGIANGDNFGMGRRIVRGSDLIAAAPNDFVASDYNRPKRSTLAAAHHINRKPDGFAHEPGFHWNSSRVLVFRETCFPASSTFSILPPVHFRRRYRAAKVKSGAVPPWPPTTSLPRP